MSQATFLNFLPIQTGGGLQNALSFLKVLPSIADASEFVAITRMGSAISEAARAAGIETIENRADTSGRVVAELLLPRRVPRRSVCFTLFGPPPVLSGRRFVNVAGFAYANILYPEVPFWAFLPKHKRIAKHAIDVYRRWAARSATMLVFETEVLRERAIRYLGFARERTAVVRMAPSELVAPSMIDMAAKQEFDRALDGRFAFLFLAGAHPNKRLHQLPSIAHEMAVTQPDARFCFVTTVGSQDAYFRDLSAEFARRGLGGMLVNTGPVDPTLVASLIAAVDVMCTFSVLESFSNNFVEAWAMRRALVVTDADWARASCGDAAVYVDPMDARASARGLLQLMRDSGERSRLIAAGVTQLGAHPTAYQKTREYLDVIDYARQLQ